MRPRFSVIVPAYNEEKYLEATLDSINKAASNFDQTNGGSIEIIVVDNASTDQTALVAHKLRATVVQEPTSGIARARDAGVKHSSGEFLIFVDADTLVPENIFLHIDSVLASKRCIGGAVAAEYHPKKRVVKVYTQMWKVIGSLMSMAQGVTQFCRVDIYRAIGGYDTSLYMSEDVDFYWRLCSFAKQHDFQVIYITEIKVLPSCRRFDEWPLWRLFLWTNPIAVFLYRHSRAFWRGWYSNAPR